MLYVFYFNMFLSFFLLSLRASFDMEVRMILFLLIKHIVIDISQRERERDGVIIIIIIIIIPSHPDNINTIKLLR